MEIRLLDMQSFDKKIVILAAAINASNTPQIYYALITLAESLSTFVINSYCQLKHNSFYTGNVLADNLKLKFILNRNIAYVYDEKVIYQVYMNGKKSVVTSAQYQLYQFNYVCIIKPANCLLRSYQYRYGEN